MSGPRPEDVAIWIPTVGRAERIPRLIANLRETAPACTLYFILEPDDAASIAAAEAAGTDVVLNREAPSYASCMNTAYRETSEPFFFFGADDVIYQPGWLEPLLHAMEDPAIGVAGTEDPVHTWPDHSTHSLIRRSYVEDPGACMDLRGIVVYPYKHNFTDLELVGTAKARGAYVYCADSKVEHHHPGWKGGRVAGSGMDATYRKSNKTHREDQLLYARRAEMWLPRIENPSRVDQKMLAFVRETVTLRGAFKYHVKRYKNALRALLGLHR